MNFYDNDDNDSETDDNYVNKYDYEIPYIYQKININNKIPFENCCDDCNFLNMPCDKCDDSYISCNNSYTSCDDSYTSCDYDGCYSDGDGDGNFLNVSYDSDVNSDEDENDEDDFIVCEQLQQPNQIIKSAQTIKYFHSNNNEHSKYELYCKHNIWYIVFVDLDFEKPCRHCYHKTYFQPMKIKLIQFENNPVTARRIFATFADTLNAQNFHNESDNIHKLLQIYYIYNINSEIIIPDDICHYISKFL